IPRPAIRPSRSRFDLVRDDLGVFRCQLSGDQQIGVEQELTVSIDDERVGEHLVEHQIIIRVVLRLGRVVVGGEWCAMRYDNRWAGWYFRRTIRSVPTVAARLNGPGPAISSTSRAAGQ